MDIATLAGLAVGITVVSLAIATGSDFSIFLNTPGFLIVIGGTFAATMIKFPLSGFFVSMPVGMKAAFTNDKDQPRDYIKLAIQLVKKGRKSGLISLEKEKIRNPFFKKGIQLCADGRDLEYIRKVLTQEMAHSIQREEVGAKVFQAIGDAAPAFGMFGTLVGLVQMLSNMSDPSSIGPAMAVALLTTLYGVLLANLIALPIADKLEDKARREKTLRSLIIECVFQIQQLQNPTAMREILEPYLPEKQRAIGGDDAYTGGAKNSGRQAPLKKVA
ncbi:MAG: MotA/TolQ/ExbB proton channel family protein [Rhodospirillales bacterium]|nr:flagellar motor protein PomA [Rhodospirillaceae bacterium]MDP6426671.1 MotA/TolQ/ExbB proton channel family protein [Rhodospirillales bacterium]MDP6645902.1 MotA/TolQ/ExbB proton channel family protein [Rhodospirillales bacterium]MDP6840759.1 MotA/TolQ/ExbB proton channel family protein [Rhodospirillales bacterium]